MNMRDAPVERDSPPRASGASRGPSGQPSGRTRASWPGGGGRREREAAAAAEAEERRRRTRALCERLREERIAQSLTLADVERDIKINPMYLEALETGHFEILPAPVYARGFMRSYARYLGLDPEEAAAAVPRDLPRPAGLEPLPGLRRTAGTPWPSLPALNTPVLAGLALTVLVVAVALLLVPRLDGGDGISLPAVPGGTSGTPVAAGDGTVPPFQPGTVPSFVGVPLAEAERVLAEAELTPLIFETANPAPRGHIFQQSPSAGEPIEVGGTVTLFVSQGPGQ